MFHPFRLVLTYVLNSSGIIYSTCRITVFPFLGVYYSNLALFFRYSVATIAVELEPKPISNTDTMNGKVVNR